MHPLEVFASCIAQSEGFFAPANVADLPKTNHNPGDLRASPLPRKKDAHGFCIFLSDIEGWMSLVVQVMLYAQRGYTIRQAITSWAPPQAADGGNNTENYIAETLRRMNAKLKPATPYTDATLLSSFFHFESIP